MTCPRCGNNDISITEEVYRHSNVLLHRLIAFILIVVGFVLVGNNNIGLGATLVISAPIYILIVRMYASVRSHKSRTKCICLHCRYKWYIG